MDRREFLRVAGLTSAAAVTGRRFRSGPLVPTQPFSGAAPGSDGSILSQPASSCAIDTVVIVMMENRSFDHFFGWLAADSDYLETGMRRNGPNFAVDGAVHQTYQDPAGVIVETRSAESLATETVETRGCTFRVPGHTWSRARIQRDHGFLAAGTGSDFSALTYFEAPDLPVYAALARRFTVFDRWHASLLGPTFPNRQYLFSAQSEGRKRNPPGLPADIYQARTIWDRLAADNVPAGYYHTDIPLLALWGQDRMAPFIHSLDSYFEDAAAGRLPNVVFVEPGFGGQLRTDDHPRGDIELGQRWVREIFRAFATSPQWHRGAFVLVYDEGGGFFDHVRPPILADDRASSHDVNNFGQAGFRVPALLASPYARRGAVDHHLYDHTSILRFLEWRFLGAPPSGRGKIGRWALTKRDRSANNMGVTLRSTRPNPDLGFDVDLAVPQPTPPCTPAQAATRLPDVDPDPFISADLADLMASRFPGATQTPWLDDVK